MTNYSWNLLIMGWDLVEYTICLTRKAFEMNREMARGGGGDG